MDSEAVVTSSEDETSTHTGDDVSTPPGYDPDLFRALPRNIQKELWQEHIASGSTGEKPTGTGSDAPEGRGARGASESSLHKARGGLQRRRAHIERRLSEVRRKRATLEAEEKRLKEAMDNPDIDLGDFAAADTRDGSGPEASAYSSTSNTSSAKARGPAGEPRDLSTVDGRIRSFASSLSVSDPTILLRLQEILAPYTGRTGLGSRGAHAEL
jgi:hypothetical protein